MRSDEPKRLKPKVNTRYLADLTDIEKPGILSWWKKQPFDLLQTEESGNCLFCFKKSTPKIALALKMHPGFAQVWFYHIKSKKVRVVKTRKTPSEVMYRGYLSLEGIAKMYEDSTIEELNSRIRGTKSLDTGSCSESCEAISLTSDEELVVNNIPPALLSKFEIMLKEIKQNPQIQQLEMAI